MADANVTAHWARSRRLATAAIVLWLVVLLLAQILAFPLNRSVVPLLGLPLGFVVAVHVSLLAFVMLAFWFARRQARIDREHGFGPENEAQS
jgi:putative solute:sodium symporter small subunit